MINQDIFKAESYDMEDETIYLDDLVGLSHPPDPHLILYQIIKSMNKKC